MRNPLVARIIRVLVQMHAFYSCMTFAQDLPDIEIKFKPATSMVCEFSPSDPKGDLLLMKEYDERDFGVPGGLLATYKISPLLRRIGDSPQFQAEDQELKNQIDKRITALEKEKKNGEFLFTGQRRDYESYQGWKKRILSGNQVSLNLSQTGAQSQEILKLIAPHNSANQNVGDNPQTLLHLRTTAGISFGEIIDSFPCETKNIRVCAKVEPFTEHATDKENETMKEADIKKLYRRISVLRIEHCLSDYPMGVTDKEGIRKACEEWPNKNEYGDRAYVPPSDAGYAGIRMQFIACRNALNAFLDKQKNLPRNERGKYIPKEHK